MFPNENCFFFIKLYLQSPGLYPVSALYGGGGPGGGRRLRSWPGPMYGFSSLCFSNNHFRSGNFMADLSTSMVLSENGAKTSCVERGGGGGGARGSST